MDNQKEIQVKIIKNKDLSENEKTIINNARVLNFGKSSKKDFKKDYESDTLWFFVKHKNKITSLGGIRPLKINYLKKDYNIGGICSIISLKKGKGYGSILISSMIDYSKNSKKTLLGFITQTKFFEKAELNVGIGLINKFIWIKPNGEKVFDSEGDGIYFEGKDKFISGILANNSLVFINIEHW